LQVHQPPGRYGRPFGHEANPLDRHVRRVQFRRKREFLQESAFICRWKTPARRDDRTRAASDVICMLLTTGPRARSASIRSCAPNEADKDTKTDIAAINMSTPAIDLGRLRGNAAVYFATCRVDVDKLKTRSG
jgi:hypothetical protein